MKKVFAIGVVNTRRFLRERSNLFFVFVFPLLLVLLLGSFFGGRFESTIGVHVAGDGPLAADLVASLEAVDDLTVREYGGESALLDAVQRGAVAGGLMIPAGYDDGLATGKTIELAYMARPDQTAMLLGETVTAVVQHQSNLVRAARFAEMQGEAGFSDALAVAAAVASVSDRVSVDYREAGDDSLIAEFENLGAFDLGAHQELILFMFLTSLAGSAALIQTRKLGVARRMLATPTSTATILGGETLGGVGEPVGSHCPGDRVRSGGGGGRHPDGCRVLHRSAGRGDRSAARPGSGGSRWRHGADRDLPSHHADDRQIHPSCVGDRRVLGVGAP